MVDDDIERSNEKGGASDVASCPCTELVMFWIDDTWDLVLGAKMSNRIYVVSSARYEWHK